jgi:tetratricopeptide (TPR) repeat protein
MKFLRKLFSAGKAPAAKAEGVPGNNTVRVFDEFGREVHIDREAWRAILPANIEKAWNDPEGLYRIIVGALNDGLGADVVNAAERLSAIDSDRGRGACVYGVVLMEQGKLEAAERVLTEHVRVHGEEGYILTNLAKVYSRRGQTERADQTLWRALELDPNQDNGVSWYVALQKERQGAAAEMPAYRRIAAIKGSWRAQLWMARAALASGDKNEAMILYRHALAHSPRPVPADLLMQISGDLGNAGHIREILTLAGPEYDPAQHGVEVGNNLIKAYTDLKMFDEAREVLNGLWAQKRPDWKQALQFWDTEIARNTAAAQPARDVPPAVTMGVISGPVWLPEGSEAMSLFEPKAADEYLIGFLCASVSHEASVPALQAHLTDDVGAMSRSLAVFLSEQVYMQSRARTRTLIPWVVDGGFAVFGARATDQEAVAQVKGMPERVHRLVALHIDAGPDAWELEVRILRPEDESCAVRFSGTLPLKEANRVVPDLAERLLRELGLEADVQSVPAPVSYAPPASLPNYFGRLGQVLAVRCAAMTENADFLYGVREMIDGSIRLCLDEPGNPTARLLLIQLALGLKAGHPEAVAESADTLRKLQERHPLAGPVDGVVRKMLEKALG